MMLYSFDGANRIIQLDGGGLPEQSFDIKDLYSRWKEWVETGSNAYAPRALLSVGGEPIDVAAGTSIPAYIYTTNGWLIRPELVDHNLTVTGGIVLKDGGGDPFMDTGFDVHIMYQQPVQAITVGLGEVEPGVSTTQALRLILAALTGKLSGAPSGPILIRDVNDTKTRISATVDANGNRTAVTVDPSQPMFPKAYFSPAYFADVYWPPAGEFEPPEPGFNNWIIWTVGD